MFVEAESITNDLEKLEAFAADGEAASILTLAGQRCFEDSQMNGTFDQRPP